MKRRGRRPQGAREENLATQVGAYLACLIGLALLYIVLAALVR